MKKYMLILVLLSLQAHAHFLTLSQDDNVNLYYSEKFLEKLVSLPLPQKHGILSLDVSTTSFTSVIQGTRADISNLISAIKDDMNRSGLQPTDFKTACKNGIISFDLQNDLYTISVKSYPAFRAIFISATLLPRDFSQAVQPYLPFGKTKEESLDICVSIILTLFNQKKEGDIPLKDKSLPDDTLPQQSNTLHFTLDNIQNLQSVSYKSSSVRKDLELGKLFIKREKNAPQNQFYVFATVRPEEKATFNLVFDNPTYQMWHQLIRYQTPLDYKSEQEKAIAFYKHVLMGNSGEAPGKKACFVTVGWLAEIQWCLRMQEAMVTLGNSSFILVTPYTRDGKMYQMLEGKACTDTDLKNFNDIRLRLFTYVNPDFSLYTHYLLKAAHDTPDFKIGYWSGFVSYVTDWIAKNLSEFDAIAYSSEGHVELDTVLNKNYVSLPTFFLAPSAPSTSFLDTDRKALFYCGNNWDKLRSSAPYKTFFTLMEKQGILKVYGEQKAWTHLTSAYQGLITAGTDQLYAKMRECGVTLCLHSAEHLEYGISSSRFFEAVAAGTVIICDDHPFFKKHFGNTCFYIDQKATPEHMNNQIKWYWEWIKSHPKEAGLMAKKAHDIFLKNFSLNKQFTDLIEFVDAQKLAKKNKKSITSSTLDPDKSPFGISIIIPTYNRITELNACVSHLKVRIRAPKDQWEVIVVADGCTDGTGEYLSETLFKQKGFENFRVVWTPKKPGNYRNGGWSRNAGAKAARFSHVTFCDTDIYHLTDPVTPSLKEIQANPDQMVAGYMYFPQPDWSKPLGESFELIVHPYIQNSEACWLVLKRKHFINLGGNSEKIEKWGYEDTDLLSRLKESGLKMIRLKSIITVLGHEYNEDHKPNQNKLVNDHVKLMSKETDLLRNKDKPTWGEYSLTPVFEEQEPDFSKVN